jgi:hypothetical protein
VDGEPLPEPAPCMEAILAATAAAEGHESRKGQLTIQEVRGNRRHTCLSCRVERGFLLGLVIPLAFSVNVGHDVRFGSYI